uniref:CSON015340 protein n=1 Tax=Culicoides sonorensis TaxID=179676 RepID=A0A336KUK7_CULSO
MALDRSVSPKRLSNSANFIHVMQFSGPNSKNFSYKIRHLSNSRVIDPDVYVTSPKIFIFGWWYIGNGSFDEP